MPTQRFEARPTLEKDGSVSWQLCHMNPNPDKCGDSKESYPDVVLGKQTGSHTFQFKITQDGTGLGIKFAADPLWIRRDTQPTGPGIDPQIEPPSGQGTPVLTFVDKNSKPNPWDPAPVVLKYQLNFVDKDNKEVTEIDPEITNGGTNFTGGNDTALLLSGVALLLLLGAIWLAIVAMKRKASRSAPAQDARTSAAERPSDVSDDRGDRL